MLYISFAPVPLISTWMFACLLNYLSVSLSILLFRVVKSLKSFLYYFPWNCMVFQYSYQYCISYYFPVLLGMFSFDVLTYTMLSLITCLISPHVMLTPDTRPATNNMTYHPPPVILIFDLWLSHLREYYTCYLILYTVTWISYLLSCIICTVTWIYSTHVLLNSWSCLVPPIPVNW